MPGHSAARAGPGTQAGRAGQCRAAQASPGLARPSTPSFHSSAYCSRTSHGQGEGPATCLLFSARGTKREEVEEWARHVADGNGAPAAAPATTAPGAVAHPIATLGSSSASATPRQAKPKPSTKPLSHSPPA
ncbi:unnamed protein product [Calypogeia fissa]